MKHISDKSAQIPAFIDDSDRVEASELPNWQKRIIDARLQKIADDPNCLRPIEDFFGEPDFEKTDAI